NAHVRRGALYYSDAISDDVQPGKATSFPQAVQLKDNEVIALAWVVYKNRQDRDRISKAVMEDPKLKESMDPSKMPFDGKRMFWGGFETIVGPSASRSAAASSRRRPWATRSVKVASSSLARASCSARPRLSCGTKWRAIP